MMMAVLLNLVWFCRFCDIDATEIDHYSTLLIMIIIYLFIFRRKYNRCAQNYRRCFVCLDAIFFKQGNKLFNSPDFMRTDDIIGKRADANNIEWLSLLLFGLRYALRLLWQCLFEDHMEIMPNVIQNLSIETFYMKINRDWKKDWKRVPCSHTNDLKMVLSSTGTLALNNFRTLGGIELWIKDQSSSNL